MRLLLSKPDSLGDQFIAAGVVQALQRQHPDWQIVWHVRTGMEVIASVLGATVFIPQTLNPPAAEAARLAAHHGSLVLLPYPLSPDEAWSDDLRQRLAWWADFLRATGWDATVLALVNRNWVGDLTAALAPAPVRIGFTANAARQLLVNEAQALAGPTAPEFTAELTPSLARSEAAQLRDLLTILEPKLGGIEPPPLWQPVGGSTWTPKAPTPGPTAAGDLPNLVQLGDKPTNPAAHAAGYILPRSPAREGRDILPRSPASEGRDQYSKNSHGILRDSVSGKHVLLAPGVGGDSRRAWGARNFQAVAETLRARGALVSWLEGPGDAPHLAARADGDRAAVIRVGADELPQLVQHLRECDLLICHDTAYVHLAAGLGVPTVAIFGAGQTTRFQPVGGRIKFVASHIACAGCQWHCLWDRLVCVADIPAATVATAAVAMLAADAAPITVELATPLAGAPEGEALALRHRLQQEILTLNADRFARLQIIRSLLARPEATQPPGTPDGEPRLSVIVPMGRPDRVAPTLASLAAQDARPAFWQIVLVGVEASSVARSHPHLPIVPVVLPSNQLPPRTRCLGVEQAAGDWFLFVDDDVELAPNTFRRLRELIAGTGNTGPESTAIGAFGFRLPGKTGRFFERLTDLSNFWAQQGVEPEDRDWLYSAAILVRAAAYHKSGGFNPDLPNGEDVDLTRRIVGAGYRLRYEPTLVARHDHRRDTLASMWHYFWRNGNAARYFFAGHGAACPFSLKTVWLKSWSDLRMNRDFQRQRHSQLGWMTPLVWLNYLIVEASLEWHWQEYLHEEQRYRQLPTRARSDRTFVAALTDWDEGKVVRGAFGYTLAVIQDFANPVRR